MATTSTQYSSSIQHQENLGRGLTIEKTWIHEGNRTDENWEVVEYSNGEFWLYDNGQPEQLELLDNDDLRTSTGTIIKLTTAGPIIQES